MEHQGTVNNRVASQISKRKRLKVSVACAPCRRRKIKCDGARPTCNSCEKSSMSAECVYTKRTNDTETSVEDNEPSSHKEPRDQNVVDRSRVVSSSLRVLSSRLSQHTAQHTYAASGDLPSSDLSTRILSLPSNPVSFENSPAESHGADSMNGVTGDPTQTPEVFGSSSAGSFMRKIQAAIDARLGATHSTAQGKPAVTTEHSPGDQTCYSSYEDPALFLLPARGLADSLMRAYWDHDWALYPIINRRKVEETYETLWTSKTIGNYPLVLMSTINLCFALGCHYCDNFFARAERLYSRVGGGPSCERVQCLLLFGIYLQSTSNVFQCWMTVGQAIRMAQSLGIHLAQPAYPESFLLSPADSVKSVLSATFGRPGMIPKWLFNSVPLPSMIDDEFFETQRESSTMRPDGQPCIMAFPVKAMELYQILDDILVSLYLTSTRDEELESKLTQMLELDGRIQAWNRSLPDHLRSHSAVKGDAVLERQAIILRVRFLHVRILLFRPAVVRICMRGALTSAGKSDDSNDSSLSDVMLSECSRMCFRLAHELIDTFERNLDPESLTGPLPNWWYSVLYVCTAATMILVERFLETKEGALKESNAYHTWHAALHVLKSYSVVADSARRFVAALEVLYEKLSLDSNTTTFASSQNEVVHDWDSVWGLSNLLNQGPENLDPGFFLFSGDDFIC
ncbi:fungal-specific transcription factor domain-containing protein [Lipomyces kononenkoae]